MMPVAPRTMPNEWADTNETALAIECASFEEVFIPICMCVICPTGNRVYSQNDFLFFFSFSSSTFISIYRASHTQINIIWIYICVRAPSELSIKLKQIEHTEYCGYAWILSILYLPHSRQSEEHVALTNTQYKQRDEDAEWRNEEKKKKK